MFFLCFDFVLLLYPDVLLPLQISSVLLCIHPSSHNSDIVYISIEDIAIESFLLKNKAMFFAMQFPQTRDYFSVL
jgi:hypothetical protein